MRKITRIVIHHSASSLETTAKQIRQWHCDKGWSDIGYHFVIEKDGIIVGGRPIDVMGAHAKSANVDSLGICIVGDNTHPERTWRPAQISSANLLIASLRTVLGYGLTVHGHRDVGTTATECPGVEIGTVLSL